MNKDEIKEKDYEVQVNKDEINEKDYEVLFKILDLDPGKAAELRSCNKAAQERYERFKTDIAGFLKYYFPEYIKSEPAEWHKAIFDILVQPERNLRNGRWVWHVTKEQADRLAALHRPEFRHLPKAINILRAIVLCAPREQAKSTVFARLVLIWLLLYGYIRFAVYFRSEDTLAATFLADTMVEFTDNRRLIADYGNLKGTVWKDGMYSLKNGSVIVSFGRGQSVRGLISRSRRPDLVILDDLTSDKDKDSPRTMAKIYDWIFSAVAGLAKDALMIYLNTIFNALDPMARILDRIERGELTRYLGVRLSAEIDDHTALWPEVWPMEDLIAKKEEVGSSIYQVEYMSIISDGKGKTLPPSIFSWVTSTSVNLADYEIHFGVDPNAEGGDDSAIAVVGRSFTTGQYLTIDQWDKDNATITELVDQLVMWNRKYEPTMIAWEQVGFQKVYQKLIQEILMSQKIVLPLIGVDAKGSKDQRALTLQPFFENGSWVHIENLKNNSSMYKINNFPMKGLNDGPVDAMALAYFSFNRELGQPVASASRRDSELPGLIGRYKDGY